MTHNPDNADPLEHVAASLQQLQPAPNQTDPAELFYRAGIAAGRAQYAGTARWRKALQLASAALVTFAIAAPISFQLGQHRGEALMSQSETSGKRAGTHEPLGESPAVPRSPAAPAPDDPAHEVIDPAFAGPGSNDPTSLPPRSEVRPQIAESPALPEPTSESTIAQSPRPDFWQRWLKLEIMINSRLAEPLATERPLGDVLTASYSPAMLERWLQDDRRLSTDSERGARVEQNTSSPRSLPEMTTLSVGDAKQWVEITRNSPGE